MAKKLTKKIRLSIYAATAFVLSLAITPFLRLTEGSGQEPSRSPLVHADAPPPPPGGDGPGDACPDGDTPCCGEGADGGPGPGPGGPLA